MVRELFEMARTKKACLIFFDEIDAIGGARFDDGAGGDNEVQRTMLELINQLDGFDPRGNIKVLMATNRPDTLDPALMRPGRLDRKIEFSLPDLEGRTHIFKIHARSMSVERDIRFELLARLCPNSTDHVSFNRTPTLLKYRTQAPGVWIRTQAPGVWIRTQAPRSLDQNPGSPESGSEPRLVESGSEPRLPGVWIRTQARGVWIRTLLCSAGAEIRSVCTEAGMFAIRARRKIATEKDFLEAVNKVIKSYAKFSATPRYMTYN
ncbi:26S protease regulatory subunit 7 [Liparis tanakae]|uniref:26S protease regulatory subunit 7 n=1 Tax=Liparis tanakae TaxID=230148 RepID=A0A4Z2ECT9_9TELE|nr:26S protease regulatory subunit 7 [Liparis tanakae]